MVLSRRSALKAFAASLAAPIIQLRPDVPDEKLLLAFCSDVEYAARWKALEKPFGIGSLTYASDRFAMVRCELANRLEVDEIKLPPVKRVWDEYWQSDGDWRPLSLQDIQPVKTDEYEPCPECHGRRVSLGDEWPDFDDPVVNAVLTRLGWDVDDNTVRDKSCPVCHGREVRLPNVSVVVGVDHSYWRMKRILALPGAMVCKTKRDDETILFRANGFEGISKGMVRDNPA